jgi:hypothetical protein
VSVHSAFDMPAIGTSHRENLRASSSSALWLRTAAVGYISICKRRSDRFAMLAASCAIAKELKRYSRFVDCYATPKLSLPVSIAHAMRAVLFARAIAATLAWRRCITAFPQRLCRSSRRFTKCMTARAPCTSRVRR